jgi:L-alanine-DL-glutamate epimerase-like enolase superfamily enzyme
MEKTITIAAVDSDFEREPLIRPFGFKGIYQNEFWVSAALLESTSGIRHTGVMTQCAAWSDINVFLSHTEAGGNMLLHMSLEYALQKINGVSFTSPIDLQEAILDEVYAYGQRITGRQDLRLTFSLSSMVALDNAAWKLYAAENDVQSFDDIIPDRYKEALAYRHTEVAAIPLMAYNIPLSEIEKSVKDGYFFMKIKIGRPGSQTEMLQGDMERIESIHRLIGHWETPYTENGKIPYYFDANGRYEKKKTLETLLDHCRKIGMLDQIAIIEEPFPEEADIYVGDLGARIAADESAHSAEDVKERIEMGYGAIALKAGAKTFSMTLKMAQAAHDKGIPCFLADLTCTPTIVDWNKNVAARLAPLPGLKKMGLLESNGHQNYQNWDKLMDYHPIPAGTWLRPQDGIYHLDSDFYKTAGGVLASSPHYMSLFDKS